MVLQQIFLRRYVDRLIKGSLLFVEEVRDGKRNDVCEVVEIFLIGCNDNDFDEYLFEILFGLGFGDLYIRDGERLLLFVLSFLLFVI